MTVSTTVSDVTPCTRVRGPDGRAMARASSVDMTVRSAPVSMTNMAVWRASIRTAIAMRVNRLIDRAVAGSIGGSATGAA